MQRKQISRVSILAAVLFATTELVPASAATSINGAGATFPAPLYSRWVSDFEKLDASVKINYQPIGSGGGIKQFIDGTVDFAGTDAPMTDEQIAQAKGNVVHIPTALGAVVLTYNVDALAKSLVLDSSTVCDIALGKITNWNDRRLQAANRGTKLPKVPLSFVHRSDGSGTSAIFTDYLSKVCPEWKEKVGAGTAVNWPAGLGAKGNDGVSGLIKQTPGAIGYVELIFAEKNALSVASMKNKSDRVIKPTTASVTAAFASEADGIPEDFRASITNAAGGDSYPISGITYLLLRRTMTKEVGSPLIKFVHWALRDGQIISPSLSYAPLPKELVSRVEKRLEDIQLK